MKLRFFQKFRFSEIRMDKWQLSIGRLSEREIIWLKIRQLVYFLLLMIKFIVSFPVSLIRYMADLIQLLEELERLHYIPLRKANRGKDCVLDKQTWFVNGHNIILGDFVKISAFSSIMAGSVSTIKIGTNSIIGPGVTIVSFNHGTKLNGVPIRYQEWTDLAEDSILIGDDVWIGASVIILPGTSIGNGSVIGAGSVIKGVIAPETITYYKNGRLKTVQRE